MTVVEPKICEHCGNNFFRERDSKLRHCWPCIADGLSINRVALTGNSFQALDNIEDGRGGNQNSKSRCAPGCNCGKHTRYATR